MDDLASFWLRKTKKPVLAVLLVQKKGCEPKLYRGTNMEVINVAILCCTPNDPIAVCEFDGVAANYCQTPFVDHISKAWREGMRGGARCRVRSSG